MLFTFFGNLVGCVLGMACLSSMQLFHRDAVVVPLRCANPQLGRLVNMILKVASRGPISQFADFGVPAPAPSASYGCHCGAGALLERIRSGQCPAQPLPASCKGGSCIVHQCTPSASHAGRCCPQCPRGNNPLPHTTACSMWPSVGRGGGCSTPCALGVSRAPAGPAAAHRAAVFASLLLLDWLRNLKPRRSQEQDRYWPSAPA